MGALAQLRAVPGYICQVKTDMIAILFQPPWSLAHSSSPLACGKLSSNHIERAHALGSPYHLERKDSKDIAFRN